MNTSCRGSRAWPLFPYCQDVDVVFQKSVHACINPPLNYTAHPVQLRPCLIGVQGITILYPWRYGKSSVLFLAPPFGSCPATS